MQATRLTERQPKTAPAVAIDTIQPLVDAYWSSFRSPSPKRFLKTSMTTTEAMLPVLFVSIMDHSPARYIITFVEAFCNTAQANDGIAEKKVEVEDLARCIPHSLARPCNEVVRAAHSEFAWYCYLSLVVGMVGSLAFLIQLPWLVKILGTHGSVQRPPH